MMKEITRDVISIIIVIGAILSLFLNVTEVGSELLRFLAGAVIGYYFGGSIIPLRRKAKKAIEVEAPSVIEQK